jgi:flagellar biogenesis protein FliO
MVHCLLALVLALTVTSRPAAAADAPSGIESEKLQIDPATAKAAAQDKGLSASEAGGDLFRVVCALGAVIFIIVLMKKLATRSGWFGPMPKAGRLVRVISRSPLAPKQHVVLLQVGKRLIVVGDSAGSLTALAQITEPDEVAALVGEAASAKSAAPVAAGFAGMFKRANRPFDADVTADEMPALARAPEPRAEEEPPVEDVGGLLEAVRSMRRQFNPVQVPGTATEAVH